MGRAVALAFYQSCIRNIEVIGNVYEDPRLLKDNQKS
jgi:hypothetical protein